MRLWPVLFLGCILTFSPRAQAAIIINEVLADPFGDANGDGETHTTRDEFIELVNTGPDEISLASWTLSDAVQVRHTFAPDSAIPAYGFFMVFGGGTPQGFTHATTASGGTLGLNNSGDTISLHDASLALIEQLTYGAEGGADVSLTRSPDAVGTFVQHTNVSPLAFSPGRTIDGGTHLPFPTVPDPLPEPEPPQDPGPDFPPLPDPEPGDTPVVPEPATGLLFGAGLAAALRRRQRRVLQGLLGLVLSLCAGAVAHSDELPAWVAIRPQSQIGPFGAVLVDPADPQRLLAGSGNMVLESTNGGESWYERFRGPAQATIASLALSDAEPSVILAATDRGVFGSFDGGARWSRVFRASGEAARCTRVAFHPTMPMTALLGTGDGLFISRDGGRRWNKMSAPATVIIDIAFEAQDPDVVYVATPDAILAGHLQNDSWDERLALASARQAQPDNGSETVTPADETALPGDMTALATHPSLPGTVYAGSMRGVQMSSDGGRTWRWLPNNGLTTPRIVRLLIQAHSPVSLYAATDQDVARYDPAGERWEPLAVGLSGSSIMSVAGSSRQLWATAADAIYRLELPGRMPAEPSPTAHDLLSNFVHEPTIAQVQQAAVQYAEVHPDKIRHWRRQATMSGLLPSLSLGWDRDSNRNAQIDEGSFPNFQVLETEDRNRNLDLSVSWDLAELIWNPDQTSIDVRSKLMVELRDDIVDEVTRLYFERRRLQVTLLTAPPADERELLDKELRVQELTALIDGMTGGYFAEQVSFSRTP